jgi:MoaA/NifB/PqqE/SkfB family radical SAM enzyme
MDVAVELTNDCNITCSYCYRKDRKVGYMDATLFKQVIDQIPRYCRVALSFAGESIMHPQFKELSEYAMKKRFRKVTLYSNGIPQYDKRLNIIVMPKPPPFIMTRDMKWKEDYSLVPEYDYCTSLYRYMAVLWDGRVDICCKDVAGHLIVGDANTQRLKDIWHCRQYEVLRKKGHCDGCEVYRYNCVGDAMAYYEKQLACASLRES